MSQVSQKWLIESPNPHTMRTLRRIFTTTKLATVIFWIAWATIFVWLYQPHGLDIYIWTHALFILLPIFTLFNMFMNRYTHHSAKWIEAQSLITHTKTLQENLRIPDPLNFKVIHWGGYTFHLANTAILDGKSKWVDRDIYQNMIGLKLTTHLGIFIFQVLSLSLFFLAAPLYYNWLMTTITPALTAHPITHLVILTLAVLYPTAFIPLGILGQPLIHIKNSPSPLKPKHAVIILLILLLMPLLELVLPLLFPVAAFSAFFLGFFLPIAFWLLISFQISKYTWGYLHEGDIPPLHPPTNTN